MADYPTITKISEIDSSTPAGSEAASKLDDAIRQIKSFLATFLAVSHTDTGGVKDSVVTAAAIPDGSVAVGKLAGGITGDKLADGTVVQGKLASNSVGTAQLIDLAVATGKLADLAVTAAKIANNTITATQLAAKAVTSTVLANDASVDANRAVTTNAIQDSAVTNAKIAAGAVTVAKMSASTGSNAAPVMFAKVDTGVVECTIGGVLSATYSAGALVFAIGAQSTSQGGGTGGVYARVEERPSANTSAGDTSANTSNVRNAWNTEFDPGGLLSLTGANTITIAKAGTFLLRISAPASGVGFHRVKFTQLTGGTVDLLTGTTEQCPAGTTTRSEIFALFTQTADNVSYQVKHWTQGAVVGGLGQPSNAYANGDNSANAEVYAIFELIKV